MRKELEDLVAIEALARRQLHAGHATSRPLSEGYEFVGLFGEAQFGKESRQPLDLELRAGGDSGWDFVIPLSHTVDVKTFRRPTHLIQEQGKVVADIYVLAGFQDEPAKAWLIGWEWGRKLARAPVRDFGYGILNHYIPATELRPMAELLDRVMHLA